MELRHPSSVALSLPAASSIPPPVETALIVAAPSLPPSTTTGTLPEPTFKEARVASGHRFDDTDVPMSPVEVDSQPRIASPAAGSSQKAHAAEGNQLAATGHDTTATTIPMMINDELAQQLSAMYHKFSSTSVPFSPHGDDDDVDDVEEDAEGTVHGKPYRRHAAMGDAGGGTGHAAVGSTAAATVAGDKRGAELARRRDRQMPHPFAPSAPPPPGSQITFASPLDALRRTATLLWKATSVLGLPSAEGGGEAGRGGAVLHRGGGDIGFSYYDEANRGRLLSAFKDVMLAVRVSTRSLVCNISASPISVVEKGASDAHPAAMGAVAGHRPQQHFTSDRGDEVSDGDASAVATAWTELLPGGALDAILQHTYSVKGLTRQLVAREKYAAAMTTAQWRPVLTQLRAEASRVADAWEAARAAASSAPSSSVPQLHDTVVVALESWIERALGHVAVSEAWFVAMLNDGSAIAQATQLPPPLSGSPPHRLTRFTPGGATTGSVLPPAAAPAIAAGVSPRTLRLAESVVVLATAESSARRLISWSLATGLEDEETVTLPALNFSEFDCLSLAWDTHVHRRLREWMGRCIDVVATAGVARPPSVSPAARVSLLQTFGHVALALHLLGPVKEARAALLAVGLPTSNVAAFLDQLHRKLNAADNHHHQTSNAAVGNGKPESAITPMVLPPPHDSCSRPLPWLLRQFTGTVRTQLQIVIDMETLLAALMRPEDAEVRHSGGSVTAGEPQSPEPMHARLHRLSKQLCPDGAINVQRAGKGRFVAWGAQLCAFAQSCVAQDPSSSPPWATLDVGAMASPTDGSGARIIRAGACVLSATLRQRCRMGLWLWVRKVRTTVADAKTGKVRSRRTTTSPSPVRQQEGEVAASVHAAPPASAAVNLAPATATVPSAAAASHHKKLINSNVKTSEFIRVSFTDAVSPIGSHPQSFEAVVELAATVREMQSALSILERFVESGEKGETVTASSGSGRVPVRHLPSLLPPLLLFLRDFVDEVAHYWETSTRDDSVNALPSAWLVEMRQSAFLPTLWAGHVERDESVGGDDDGGFRVAGHGRRRGVEDASVACFPFLAACVREPTIAFDEMTLREALRRTFRSAISDLSREGAQARTSLARRAGATKINGHYTTVDPRRAPAASPLPPPLRPEPETRDPTSSSLPRVVMLQEPSSRPSPHHAESPAAVPFRPAILDGAGVHSSSAARTESNTLPVLSPFASANARREHRDNDASAPWGAGTGPVALSSTRAASTSSTPLPSSIEQQRQQLERALRLARRN